MKPDPEETKQESVQSNNPSADSTSSGSLESSSSLEEDTPETSSTQQPESIITPDSDNKTPTDNLQKPDDKAPGKLFSKVKSFVKKFDIYLLVFVFVIVVALIIAFLALQKNNTGKPTSAGSQSLSQSALSQLNNNDTQVGTSSQTLNIGSNTVFAGNVLVKSDLDVAGSLHVSGPLSIPGITVAGTTNLGQVNAGGLTLSGSGTINGTLNVKQNLSVAGTGSFGGDLSAPELTVSSLQINGALEISHHITSTGSIPRSTTGGAVGGGGTTSVNGNDTAGTININDGSGASSGCLTTITYGSAYASTPHVVVTPVGASGANIGYYINSSAGSFSLCATSPPSGQSFSFDYIVIG